MRISLLNSFTCGWVRKDLRVSAGEPDSDITCQMPWLEVPEVAIPWLQHSESSLAHLLSEITIISGTSKHPKEEGAPTLSFGLFSEVKSTMEILN